MSRWVDTHTACGIWGGGICCRTMRRMLEKWYDTGYAIESIVLTPGGHWRVERVWLIGQREKVGQDGQAMREGGDMS